MTALQFNADEIFTMAEKIEINGAKFYRNAAKKYFQQRELLEKLAAMEDNHFKRFSLLHKSISEREKESLSSDPDGQGAAMAQVWANGHVFDFSKDPSETVKKISAFSDVVKFAIKIEKESIVFYLGMKEMVPNAAGREQLDAIISEEMGHIRILNELV
jgi:rubrerythrin